MASHGWATVAALFVAKSCLSVPVVPKRLQVVVVRGHLAVQLGALVAVELVLRCQVLAKLTLLESCGPLHHTLSALVRLFLSESA